MPCTLVATSSFLSGRTYPPELFTSSFFLLDPCSDYLGVNISLHNSSLLFFLNIYAAPICSLKDSRTNSFSPSILSSSRNLFILGDFSCHHPQSDSMDASNPRGEEVFDWVISSNLLPSMTLTYLLFCIAPLTVAFFLTFPLLPPLLASCSWEVLQDLGSDHLPILLIIPLSLVVYPNKRSPSFNFQKARWDDFAYYIDSHCPSAEEYLSLSSAAALLWH